MIKWFCALALLILPLTFLVQPYALESSGITNRMQVSGFKKPYAGSIRYLRLAPKKASSSLQINKPLGQFKADRIAAALGFRKSKALSKEQFILLISGQGVGGGTPQARAAAKTIDESVNYLTNSNANKIIRNINGVPTLINLGSYGLIVNEEGALESPGNTTAPTRKVNVLLQPPSSCGSTNASTPVALPCGYVDNWLIANGAEDSLIELYSSAFFIEAVYGANSQDLSGVAQLVPNSKPNGDAVTVGMSMAPSIWVTNFLLIYMLNPRLAALMPDYWTPIPEVVVNAIVASESGQVPYSEFQSYFTK